MRRWLFLVCLFLVSLPAVNPRLYSSDEIQYFAYLRSAWFDRDLSFENEYRYFYDRGIAKSDGFHETFLERQTETGRRINFATVGCAILWSPFYAVGDAIARVSGAPADGYSKPYISAIAFGSAVYGFAAILLSILSARRLGLDAFVPALAIWFGTPLLFYMYIAPPFSHACSAFGVALFIYVWLRVRDDWSPSGLAALGATAALMTMIREQDAFFVVGPALDFGLSWALGFRLWALGRGLGRGSGASQSLKPKAQSLIAAVVAFAVVFAPQAIAYVVLNGHIGPHSSVGRKMNWAAPHGLQVLFNPEHGFLIWTPLAAVALIGLLLRRNRVFVLLLVMVAFQVYVAGSVESWTVAGAFGQRRFIALTAILIVGLSALWQSASSRAARSGLAIITVLGVYWNLALTAEFGTGLMDRQKLEPRKNAYDAFVTLPKEAPALAYRYLFDRASFYKPKT